MKPIFAAALLGMGLSPIALHAQQPRWPLAESAKSPTKALSVPTKLDPVAQSLSDILNGGGQVVNASVGNDGPIVTVRSRKTNFLCLVRGANPATDQTVATSECYKLN